MSLTSVSGVHVAGIASCVPKNKADNLESALLGTPEDAERFVKGTGIRFRHYVDEGVCTSDLCEKAANKLIDGLGWKKEDIDIVVMVTQTPDYLTPNTAILMQQRLGLSNSCIAFDIPLGCSGYVYGLFAMSSMLSATGIKKGLLLVGDTLSRQASPKDKSAYPLFGDAATATALEFTGKAEDNLKFLLGSDGAGYESIIVPAGGYREPITAQSLQYSQIEEGIERMRTNTVMIGTDVFTFGISVVPAEFKKFAEHFNVTTSDIDYAFFHQANKFMNEKIRKKIGLSEEQVPYSLPEYGNTSSATIPLTISYRFKDDKKEGQSKNFLLCGFGVGLSWGICYFNSKDILLPDIIEY